MTPESPTRALVGLVKVNKLGVTELVSSLTYTKETGPPQDVETRKKIEVSPLLASIQVTPRTTKLNQTPSSSKSERCREMEARQNGPKNCIEIFATVKNVGTHPITNVQIPEANDPLKMINVTNPKLPGEPLRPLEATIPAAPFRL